MAFGFFPALGMLLIALFYVLEKDSGRPSFRRLLSGGLASPPLLLWSTAAITIVMGILSMLSRGTLVSFSAALAFYFIFLLIKFPPLKYGKAMLLVLALFIGFMAWLGEWGNIQKELKTLEKEQQGIKSDMTYATDTYRTIYHHREGVARASKMSAEYPVWGVGTNGYSSLSEFYATPVKGQQFEAKYFAMCHYLQLLAEEGKAGLFFYGLFLVSFLLNLFYRLLKTQSRFKFLTALSLLAPCVMVLTHGVINALLQKFTMSLLLYLAMGAALGLMREDFEKPAPKQRG
jgi:predicted membrane protein